MGIPNARDVVNGVVGRWLPTLEQRQKDSETRSDMILLDLTTPWTRLSQVINLTSCLCEMLYNEFYCVAAPDTTSMISFVIAA